MRSLFAKILLWLVAMAVATAVSATIVASLSGLRGARSPLPALLLQFFADEAQRAWRDGELEHYFARLERTAQMEGHLVDREGTDLVDRMDRTGSLRQARRSPFWFGRDGVRFLLAQESTDHRHVLLLYPHARAAVPLLSQPHLWMLLCVLLFSYLLAKHLTDPLRRVAAAADRFGSGDLTARAPEGRQDEVGSLAVSFNRMAARIQDLVQGQQRLLLDVSHELRSPLSRLNVAVELARGVEKPDRELDVIQQQADRLNTLVGSLLQVSRAEADAAPLSREPLALRHLLEAVVGATAVEANAAGVSLTLATDATTLPADRELLHRAFENIVRNAIRYAPPGSTIAIEQQAGRIAIRDHGPGVPGEALPRLFDLFYRVEGQQGPGTGLGLSIAKRAIALHGGRIHAENAQPGLRVVVHLAM
ncbi:MAG: HAMP domain-containing protein [Bryobacterales bacterium]|nr:HAMP domain-containing protein [Bryobacterales bacterium]